jgi:hypothetical protein
MVWELHYERTGTKIFLVMARLANSLKAPNR